MNLERLNNTKTLFLVGAIINVVSAVPIIGYINMFLISPAANIVFSIILSIYNWYLFVQSYDNVLYFLVALLEFSMIWVLVVL